MRISHAKTSSKHTHGLLATSWNVLARIKLLLLCVVLLSSCAARMSSLEQQEEGLAAFPEVREILFLGNQAYGDVRLRKLMVTRQRSLWSPWKHGGDYNPAMVDTDLLRLEKYYFDRGYLDVRVTVAKVEQNEAGDAAQIHIQIQEGERTMVRDLEVRVEGPVPPELPSIEVLGNTLPLRVDAPITKEAFDASMAQLLLALRRAGYARAKVRPRTEVDRNTHEASVTFSLAAGERTAFGQVTIEGAERVKAEAIRRRLTFQPGEIYSPGDVADSQAAIYDLGMFRRVMPRRLNPDATGEPLDMAFEVNERKPRSFEIGVGLSTVERFRLQAEWTFRNLFGGAEQLSLSGKVSSLGAATEARLHLPYFGSRRTRFTQTIFADSQREINTDPLGLTDAIFEIEDAQPAFDVLRYGGQSRVDHQFTKTVGGAVGIDVSGNTFSNVDPDALLELAPEVAENHFLFVQFGELAWNTSNSAVNATRGLWSLLRVDHSTTGILSGFDFVKASVEGRLYLPLPVRMTLATRVKIGFVQPYGDSEVAPFNVRFFAGGPGSIRGFALNRVGPLDANHEPIGGHSLIEGGAELRFPLLGKLGGVLFADFGQVFEPSLDYHFDDLRYAVGPGIRYNTPIGPIRFDLGFIVDRRADEPFGRVELSIVQAF